MVEESQKDRVAETSAAGGFATDFANSAHTVVKKLVLTREDLSPENARREVGTKRVSKKG